MDKEERAEIYCIFKKKRWGPQVEVKVTRGGDQRRNTAHELTSDGCQLPPKKREVGNV